MYSRGRVTEWLFRLFFGEEHADTAAIIAFLLCILALIILTCHEFVVYKKRFGDRASLKGFWRFHKEYPAERRRKAEARRKEREARKEARCKEKDQQKENKD